MAAHALIDRMQAVYASYNEGNAEPFSNLFANDSVVRWAAPSDIYPFAGPNWGPDGARRAIGLIAEDYQWLGYTSSPKTTWLRHMLTSRFVTVRPVGSSVPRKSTSSACATRRS